MAQSGSVATACGHELLHKRFIVHKIFGTALFTKWYYSTYFIEHVRVHHKHVCTPKDPITAKLGESIFQYYRRAVPENLIDVLYYEQNRLKKEGNLAWW